VVLLPTGSISQAVEFMRLLWSNGLSLKKARAALERLATKKPTAVITGIVYGNCALVAMDGSDSRFVSASSASRSQAADILVRLTLVSGSKLLCAISAQCAECSRYVAAFSLPDIQSPRSFDAQLKAATPGFGSALHNAGGVVRSATEKTLSCQSPRKFNFHTFATIWLPLYLG
jgi:hypothetical protein